MFTGLVEEVGRVAHVVRTAGGMRLSIAADVVLEDLCVGDSIAVSGVCLTATAVETGSFQADVVRETLSRSTLAGLRTGSEVNLERAMAADGRFGGHMVAGHVDGQGTVLQVRADGMAVNATIQIDRDLARYIVEKGSVALDGVSLTVSSVGGESFSVSLIPHTAARTTLADLRPGRKLNVEVDLVGKYVERLLSFRSPDTAKAADGPDGTLRVDRLREMGF